MAAIGRVVSCQTELSVRHISGLTKPCTGPMELLNNRTKIRAKAEEVTKTALDRVLQGHPYRQAHGVSDWIKKIVQYNTTSSKLIRTSIAVHTHETLDAPHNVGSDALESIHVLALCNELVHSHYVILDDIEDSSVTRRGRPCWHTLPSVGLSAVNDASLIRGLLYSVLREYFGNRECYAQVVRLFDEAFVHTSIGQYLDTATAKKQGYSLYTMDQYDTISAFKTANYSIKLPIMLGAILSRQNLIEEDKNVHKIINIIGKIFQMQNDFEDCYKSSVVGKEGTDIQERKCSWLAVTALQRCSASQREEFASSYGRSEISHVERIKRLYNDLRIPELYQAEHTALQETAAKCIQLLKNERMAYVLSDVFYLICKYKV